MGRQEEDMSTVGLFLQPLPIRVSRRSPTAEDLCNSFLANCLLAVQDSARSALSHAIEWTSLLKLLSSTDDEGLQPAASKLGPNLPLFDALVTFHE
jgi:hypothetical protein